MEHDDSRGASFPLDYGSRLIGITMGCPVGIGPEIILRFMADTGEIEGFRPVVLGDIGVLERCAGDLAINVDIVQWRPDLINIPSCAGVIPVMPLSRLEPSSLQWGQPNIATGRAMAAYIEEAAHQARQGKLAAMVTCPITKSALHMAGYNFPGHTEMLASLCASSDYAMMMAGAKLRVTLVTIHVSLAAVPTGITTSDILKTIHLTGSSLQGDFGIEKPRIAVAGLNPHAGEDGLFGDEEARLIGPAVSAAVADGWTVMGPYPPDTLFYKAAAGEFDAVVCMYHDQGLIPFKLIHFVDGVNVTMGLPIVRTSVDYGTAYDIAGKGLASPASLRAAFVMAAEIATNRRSKKVGLIHGGGEDG